MDVLALLLRVNLVPSQPAIDVLTPKEVERETGSKCPVHKTAGVGGAVPRAVLGVPCGVASALRVNGIKQNQRNT